MNITASMVKDLRERTGAGMMECKRALEESSGDLEVAVTAMRKSGQAKAAKRAGRVAAEGIIALLIDKDQKVGFMVDVNCETDFVARSSQFKTFVQQISERGLQIRASDAANLLSASISENENQTIEQARQTLVSVLGENINIRRAITVQAAGSIGGYLHGDRIGVLVALNHEHPDLARDLAMHIAATNPLAIAPTHLAESILKKEREIFVAQAKESGKPDNIVEKMVQGRIEKFLQEVCLVNQNFIKDSDQTINKLLQTKQTEITEFARFEVGEGIEKIEQDFANEVKAQLEGSN